MYDYELRLCEMLIKQGKLDHAKEVWQNIIRRREVK